MGLKVIEFINVINIKVDKHSISKETYDLAKKLDNNTLTPEDLPPIKVEYNKGTFILKDGRHRVTAFKLLGLKRIKARFNR